MEEQRVLNTVRRIDTPLSQYYTGTIRNRDSPPEAIRNALDALGREVGRELISLLRLEPAVVVTPLNETCSTLQLRDELTAVVTTKADLELYGKAIAAMIEPAIVGFMDFGGRRGLAALDSPVREIELPASRGRQVSYLVIAKSVLATGCTAVSLTRTAMGHYSPNRLVIATLFYSLSGIHELASEFPEAEFLVVGNADRLDDAGMLHPGVGLIEQRAYRTIAP
ncbi:uracil phosphoribosyltransferase [Micromonospora zamorensis]|uniref:uracil phosphoribosyltransferase n=1 Tax=Micromonospora zamorensis TaxID=709883 RepID=UPI00369E953B